MSVYSSGMSDSEEEQTLGGRQLKVAFVGEAHVGKVSEDLIVSNEFI